MSKGSMLGRAFWAMLGYKREEDYRRDEGEEE